MSVYNGEAFLADALDSILNQTFRDFEFIIVDDGSTDNTAEILARYGQADARIRLHTHPTNAGIVASANDGCRLATGEYVARMDADDVCAPNRFARQVDYLTRHPEIGVLGAWFRVADNDGRTTEIQRPPTLPGVVGWTLLFANCFCNSSIMMRRAALEQAGFYRPEAMHGTEDYDLFVRLSHITRLANLPEILCTYRTWPGNVSNRRAPLREPIINKIVQEAVCDLLDAPISIEAARYLRGLTGVEHGTLPGGLPAIQETARLLRQVYRRYREETALSAGELHAVSWSAAYRLYVLSRLAARHSLRAALPLRAQALSVNPLLALTIDARKFIRRVLAR
jgi:glycosyl transferase family 2